MFDKLLMIVYRRFAKSRPGLYRATLSAPKPTDIELIAVSSEFLDVMKAVMSPLQLRGNDVIHAMRALRSLVHGFVSLEAVHGFGLPQEIDESFHFMPKALCAPSFRTASPTCADNGYL